MNKKIFIVITSFLVLFVSLTIYFLIPRSYVVFRTAPQKVVVLIDSKDRKNINNGETITLNPGKHKFTIFRDEFNPYSTEINIKNGETVEVVAALFALTDNARDLLNNTDSIKVMEKYTGIAMDEQSEKAKLNYPILKVLPIDSRYYRLYSCQSEKYPNDTQKIAICISMDDIGFKDMLYQDIKSLNYNLDDYELIWL